MRRAGRAEYLSRSGASWGESSMSSEDGRAGKEVRREGEEQTTSSEPGVYLMKSLAL